MSTCTPCKPLDCVNPNDYATYNLDGPATYPGTPALPPVGGEFLNVTVYFDHICGLTEILTFTGTLPSWITLDAAGGRLVGRAGVFGASTQSAADAQAQAALNTFGNAVLASGQLTCEPIDPCDSIADWYRSPGTCRLRIKDYTPGTYFLTAGCLTCNASADPEWDGTFSYFFNGFALGDEYTIYVADNTGGNVSVNGKELATYSSLIPGFPQISLIPLLPNSSPTNIQGGWRVVITCLGTPSLIIWQGEQQTPSADPRGIYLAHVGGPFPNCASNATVEVESYVP